MTRSVTLVVCCALLASALQASAEDTPQEESKRFDVVEDLLAAASAEGASGLVRISEGGELLYEGSFGFASCTDDEPVTADHVFMIGSITKEFTQLLAYVLEEKGYFALDDTVASVMPQLGGPIRHVTISQLVFHTGGVPDLIDEEGRPVPYSVEYDYEHVSRDELLARASKVSLIFEPGENEEYSNLGYQLLAAMYEVATGETYPALLQKYVFDPAGMDDTAYRFDDSTSRLFADGCESGGEHWGNPIDDGMWDEAGPSWNLIGAGGLLSTAESLARFFDGLAAGVYFESEEQLQNYKSTRMVYSERRQQLVMGPAGSNTIFNAVAYWLDDDEFNAVMFTNRADHPAEGGLVQDVLRATLPTPARDQQ